VRKKRASKKAIQTDRELREKIKSLGWEDPPSGLVEKIGFSWGNQARWVLVDGGWYFSEEDRDRLDKSWKRSSYGP